MLGSTLGCPLVTCGNLEATISHSTLPPSLHSNKRTSYSLPSKEVAGGQFPPYRPYLALI